eukprot:XP_014032611.1 PREDICTED: uncharacterized protein LOC106588301 [Salmo salar]
MASISMTERDTSGSTGSNVDPLLTTHELIEIHPVDNIKVDLNEEGTVRRCTVGTKNVKPNKTVLLMGATGVGKSTLINYIANYIFGVNFEDNKRFQLIPDEKKSQTVSQTTAITVYEIFGHEGDRVPFSVTIIDTPGFGDTNGIEQDQLITKNLQELFESKNGVHQIDAVCFVVREDEVRLTLTQRYIFESILSIFGKDIEKNILALVTFASRGNHPPPALKAIMEAGIPCSKEKLKFNITSFTNRSADPEIITNNKRNWSMGEKSMTKFINLLTTLETRSLQLTQEVLAERRHLEACIDGIEDQLKITLDKQIELKEIQNVLKGNKEMIDAQKDFEFVVITNTFVRIESEKMATNCNNCGMTCHLRCPLAPQKLLFLCEAMRNRQCKICPGKCSWKDHVKEKVVYQRAPKVVKKTYNNIQFEYGQGVGGTITSEDMEEKIQSEIQESEDKGNKLLETSYKCVARLEEIALRPNPLTAEEYIDLLIHRETENINRVKKLQEMKAKALLISSMTKEKIEQGTGWVLKKMKGLTLHD